MEQWLTDYQLWCRIGFFILTFGLLAWWETQYPWRPWLVKRSIRWTRHLSLSAISILCVRMAFPLFTVGAAIVAQNKGIGLLNQFAVPTISKVILGILAMDFVIYVQHRLLHKYQWLWRLHRIHHIDRQLDVSTGVRFHPLEAMISMGMKIVGVTFFGVPPLGAFIFEILLNMASLFTHVNVRLNAKTDIILRRLIVTPGMHRIHHSDYPPETNSNYGFCLSWWDRLFGSYTMIAQTGERKLSIGLEEYLSPKYQTLENMLFNPFDIKRLKVRPKKRMKTKFKLYERGR